METMLPELNTPLLQPELAYQAGQKAANLHLVGFGGFRQLLLKASSSWCVMEKGRDLWGGLALEFWGG